MDEGRRVGPYVLERRLGQGGMGDVWAARHAATGAVHALKLVGLGDHDAALRAAREVEATARLDGHPNLVRVHGAFVEAGRLVLVMELVEGEDLGARLARTGPMPVDAAVQLARDLAGAVAHAHARGVLHRDLKPANVLLDAAGTPRLIDLGLARVVDQATLTRTGDVLGTPAFMAPEQARGERCDERSDVFGLGAVLFAALTGKPPRRPTASPVGAMLQAATEPLARADALRPEVPRALADVVARATAFDPAGRHAAVADLARDLEAWSRGAPAGAPRRGAARRVVGALVVVAAVVAGLGLAAARARSRAAAAQEALRAATRYEQEVVAPWAFGLGEPAPRPDELRAHARSASQVAGALPPDDAARARALAARLASLAPLVGAPRPAGVAGDAVTDALVAAVLAADAGRDLAPFAAALARPEPPAAAARLRVRLAALARATDPADADDAARAAREALGALVAPVRSTALARVAEAVGVAASASVQRLVRGASSDAPTLQGEVALADGLDALARAAGDDAVAALSSARERALVGLAEEAAGKLARLADDGPHGPVFDHARALARVVPGAARRIAAATDERALRSARLGPERLAWAACFDVAWRLVLGGPPLEGFEGWYEQARRAPERFELPPEVHILVLLSDCHRTGETSWVAAKHLPRSLRTARDRSRVLAIAWLGNKDQDRSAELAKDPAGLLDGLEVALGLAEDARPDFATQCSQRLRVDRDVLVVRPLLGSAFRALAALEKEGHPAAEPVGAGLASIARRMIERWSDVDVGVACPVLSEALHGLRGRGEDTSDERRELLRRLEVEPTRIVESERAERADELRFYLVGDLAAAGRRAEALRLAEDTWADRRHTPAHRAQIALCLADDVRRLPPRDPDLARAWFERATALAREEAGEGWEAWLGEVAPNHYARLAMLLAR